MPLGLLALLLLLTNIGLLILATRAYLLARRLRDDLYWEASRTRDLELRLRHLRPPPGQHAA